MSNPMPIPLSVMQAQRAIAMARTVGEDYHQPLHTTLQDVLPKARLEDGSALSDEEIEALSRQIVLPGAKRAIHFATLGEMHARGLAVHEMVAEINRPMSAALAPQHARFIEWRDGPLAEHVREIQARAERKRQLMNAREAEIERQLDEDA